MPAPWLAYPEDFDHIYESKYPGSGTEEDPYFINWIDGDKEDPQGWPEWYKWYVTIFAAVSTLAATFCSSAYAGAAGMVYNSLGKPPHEAVTAGLSVYVLGFALGPLLWGPLSEAYGRRFVFILTFVCFTAFNAACAGAPNIGALVVLRFFAGSFGSSPLTNAGGNIADMFPASKRGLALSLFAAAPFLGPAIGPIVAGFAGEALGWRWVEWLMVLFSGVMLLIGTITIPETYAPVLLRQRAAELSRATGKVFRSRFDRNGVRKFRDLMSENLVRPWILMAYEPIVLLLCIYMALIYGILYMLFDAFPVVFEEERGWGPGIGALPFLGVAIGMLMGVTYTMLDNARYVRVADEHNGVAPPEARLPPAIVGSVAIPVGLFWFAWTNYPSIHWIVCIIATVPFGFGMIQAFLACTNYLIDAYLIYAASVLAAKSVLRSLFGAIFPLFTIQMYHGVGIHWASCIPAFLAVLCMPFPFLFWKYGHIVRAKCKYAKLAAAVLEGRDGEAAQGEQGQEKREGAKGEPKGEEKV